MKNIALSLAMIALVASVVIGGTTAFFSDEEASEGNVFAAGAIDLQIDNTSYGFDWNDPTVDDPQGVWGENSANTWQLTDLTDELFFNFEDLKPGDYGEDTISIHVDDNDAWACMAFDLTATPENGLNEPEAEVDETDGDDEGELQNYLSFLFWWDDGDNVLENDEQLIEPLNGLSGDVFTGAQLAIADSTTNDGPLEGGTTHYIGKGWCFGEISADPVAQGDYGAPTADNTGFTCNGEGDHNDAQTDGIEVDVSFNAVQSRNNEDFVCEGGDDGFCSEEVDVMLVLDSSGSIGGDMTTLQDAAKSFASALSPSADGAHVGVVDFDGDATLEQELTDDTSLIESAIDGLSSGGNTNLEEGIRVAQAEFANGRADAPDVMVVITDGEPNRSDGNDDAGGNAEDEAEAAATDSKNAGTEIFAVGVGSGVDATYLQDSIVSAPSSEHYFDSDDFDDLEQILIDLTDCPDNGDGGDQREAVGADLAAYSAPECGDTVAAGDSIQTAIDDADPDDVICLGDGTHNEDEFPLRVNKDNLTLAGENGPTNTAVLTGGVILDNPGTTLTGVHIDGESTLLSETFGVYVNTAAVGAAVSYNIIEGEDTASSRGIVAATGLSDLAVMHNEISGWHSGVFLNTSSNMEVSHNTLTDNNVGSSNDGPDGNSIHHNIIANNDIEGVGVSDFSVGNDGSLSVNFNNIYGNPSGEQMNNYDLGDDDDGFEVDAEDNWWGDDTPGNNISGSGDAPIDFEPFETSAFPEN